MRNNRPDITQYSITCPPLAKGRHGHPAHPHARQLERTIIFCNTKVMCQRLSDDLKRFGIQADCIHGDIPQQKREKTMRTFKEGKLPVLDCDRRCLARHRRRRCRLRDQLRRARGERVLHPPHRQNRQSEEKGHRCVHPRHVPGAGEARGDRKILALSRFSPCSFSRTARW